MLSVDPLCSPCMLEAELCVFVLNLITSAGAEQLRAPELCIGFMDAEFIQVSSLIRNWSIELTLPRKQTRL